MQTVNRTVVYLQRTLEEDKSKRFQFYLSSPYGADANIAYPFNLDLEDDPFAKLQEETPDGEPCVRNFGNRLFNVLIKHEAVAKRFTSILESEEQQPIYFHVGPMLSDDLPWETLYCEQVQFVALDSRFPIAHLHDVDFHGSRGTDYTLTLPMKITLVLSAPPADVGSKSQSLREWENFWEKLSGKNLGLPLEINVLTSDAQVLEAVGRLGLDWITAVPIVSRAQLLLAISAFGPRFLHFYCPCSVDGTLEVPTESDWSAMAQNIAGSSIRVTARELRDRGDRTESIWAVTLNCIGVRAGCEDERSGSSSAPRTLARQLIRSAFPVAVTTRETVSAAGAGGMFAQFYMDAIGMISAVPADGRPHPIEWGTALLEGRANLIFQAHRNDSPELRAYCRHWTTPVLYARPEPFIITRPRPGSNVDLPAAAERRTLLDILDKLGAADAGADAAHREALEKIKARVAELLT